MTIQGLFCYLIRIIVPATTTITPQITIDSENDFELHEVRGNVQAQGAIFIQLSNSNGYQWSNGSFDAATISAGANANNKVALPYPVLVPKSTQINVQLQNISGAPITYELQFWGVKC